jgi:TrmH family RNA methyltransferase
MLSKAHISRIKALHQKAFRIEAGLFIAEGEKLVEDLLNSGMEAVEIFMLEAAFRRSADRLPDGTGTSVSIGEMERITSLSTPSPVIGIFRMKKTGEFNPDCLNNEIVLALDEIRDPGNLGTIIRTADWFGIKNIVCSPGCVELYNPKVVQSTMGSLARVDVFYPDLQSLLTNIPKSVPVIGTLLEGENIYTSKPIHHGVVIVGNEAHGISDALKSLITHRLFIPPKCLVTGARPESLNASVATAIVLSEIFRQQNYS